MKITKEQLLAAKDKIVPDVIDFNLKVLFVGINPGLYTAAIGHHFGRPGNRFWKTLYLAEFTDRLYSPFEDQGLVKLGLGITNLVPRASAQAEEITKEEFKKGAKNLEVKIKKFKPKNLVFLGVGAYRIGFNKPQAKIGLQMETIGETKIWVLPNPSGLNAHFKVNYVMEILKKIKASI